MDTVLLLVRDGFELAVLVALPVLGAAAGASLMAGLATGALGVQDTATVGLARLAGAVLGVRLVLATATDRLVSDSEQAFGERAELGRAGIEGDRP